MCMSIQCVSVYVCVFPVLVMKLMEVREQFSGDNLCFYPYFTP